MTTLADTIRAHPEWPRYYAARALAAKATARTASVRCAESVAEDLSRQIAADVGLSERQRVDYLHLLASREMAPTRKRGRPPKRPAACPHCGGAL